MKRPMRHRTDEREVKFQSVVEREKLQCNEFVIIARQKSTHNVLRKSVPGKEATMSHWSARRGSALAARIPR